MLQTFSALLNQKEFLTKTVLRLDFKLQNPNELIFKAGQYLMLVVNDKFRLYSISSSPSKKQNIEIIVDISPMGIGATYINNLKINDLVTFKAPAGIFTLKESDNSKVFLATGSGIAPMKSMILDLIEKSSINPIYLFWGLKNKQDVHLINLWEDLSKKNPNFNYKIALSREGILNERHFLNGHVQDCLQNLLDNSDKVFDFYLCGRSQMIDSLKTELITKYKVAENNIFHEKYS